MNDDNNAISDSSGSCINNTSPSSSNVAEPINPENEMSFHQEHQPCNFSLSQSTATLDPAFFAHRRRRRAAGQSGGIFRIVTQPGCPFEVEYASQPFIAETEEKEMDIDVNQFHSVCNTNKEIMQEHDEVVFQKKDLTNNAFTDSTCLPRSQGVIPGFRHPDVEAEPTMALSSQTYLMPVLSQRLFDQENHISSNAQKYQGSGSISGRESNPKRLSHSPLSNSSTFNMYNHSRANMKYPVPRRHLAISNSSSTQSNRSRHALDRYRPATNLRVDVEKANSIKEWQLIGVQNNPPQSQPYQCETSQKTNVQAFGDKSLCFDEAQKPHELKSTGKTGTTSGHRFNSPITDMTAALSSLTIADRDESMSTRDARYAVECLSEANLSRYEFDNTSRYPVTDDYDFTQYHKLPPPPSASSTSSSDFDREYTILDARTAALYQSFVESIERNGPYMWEETAKIAYKGNDDEFTMARARA